MLYELRSVWYSSSGGAVEAQSTLWKGVRRGDFKLVWKEGDGGAPLRQLYDVRRDPRERRDLAPQRPDTVAELELVFGEGMERALRDAQGYRAGGRASLSDEEIEQLRALGYFDG
jgi:hypothetical protein